MLRNPRIFNLENFQPQNSTSQEMTATPLGNHLTTNSNSPSLLQPQPHIAKGCSLKLGQHDTHQQLRGQMATQWLSSSLEREKEGQIFYHNWNPIICDLSITSDFEGVSSPLDKSQWPQYVSADTWNTPETISSSDNNEIQNRFSVRTRRCFTSQGSLLNKH